MVAATRDLNLGTVNTSSSQSLAWGSKNWRKDSTQQEVGSSIQTNGDLRLSAGNDLNARGALVTSEQGALVATAGNNVNLSAAQTTRDVDEAHQFKGSSSWFSKKTITTRNTLSETTTQGTTFSGNTTYVQAGNDINVKGSNVVSTEGKMNPEVLWLSGKGSQGSPAALVIPPTKIDIVRPNTPPKN